MSPQLMQQDRFICPAPPQDRLICPAPPQDRMICPAPPQDRMICPAPPQDRMICPAPPQDRMICPSPPQDRMICPAPPQDRMICPSPLQDLLICPAPPQDRMICPCPADDPPQDRMICPAPPQDRMICPAPPQDRMICPGPPQDLDDLPIASTRSDDLPIASTRSDDLPSTSTRSDDLPIASTRSDDLPIASTRSDDLPSTSTRLDDLPSTSTRSVDLPSTSTRSVDLPIASTRSDDLPSTSTRSVDLPSTSTRSVDLSSTSIRSVDLPITSRLGGRRPAGPGLHCVRDDVKLGGLGLHAVCGKVCHAATDSPSPPLLHEYKLPGPGAGGTEQEGLRHEPKLSLLHEDKLSGIGPTCLTGGLNLSLSLLLLLLLSGFFCPTQSAPSILHCKYVCPPPPLIDPPCSTAMKMISWVKMMEMEKYTPHSCKFFDAAGARGEGPETPRIMAQTFRPYPNETLMKKYLFWAIPRRDCIYTRIGTSDPTQFRVASTPCLWDPSLATLKGFTIRYGNQPSLLFPPLSFLEPPLRVQSQVFSSPLYSRIGNLILHYFVSLTLPLFWIPPTHHSKVSPFGLETCATIDFLHFFPWMLPSKKLFSKIPIPAISSSDILDNASPFPAGEQNTHSFPVDYPPPPSTSLPSWEYKKSYSLNLGVF